MQFSSVFPLEGKACVSPVRREGSGSERVRIGDCSSTRQNRALRRMCFGARGTTNSAQCVLTSDAGPDTLVSLIPLMILLVFHHCHLQFI
jgi:glucose-1-phosphate adenylyltransferase